MVLQIDEVKEFGRSLTKKMKEGKKLKIIAKWKLQEETDTALKTWEGVPSFHLTGITSVRRQLVVHWEGQKNEEGKPVLAKFPHPHVVYHELKISV